MIPVHKLRSLSKKRFEQKYEYYSRKILYRHFVTNSTEKYSYAPANSCSPFISIHETAHPLDHKKAPASTCFTQKY